MTRQITDDELMQIRERADKATEGPWEAIKFNYIRPVNGFMADDLVGEATENEDADFIANAREDIPKLLAEIDRLKKRVGEATSLLHLDTELIDKQAAEIKRMREQLQIIYSDTFHQDTDYVSVKHVIRKRSEKALGGVTE